MSGIQATAPACLEETDSKSADVDKPAPALKKVIASSAIGQFVEWYDFVVYAYSYNFIAMFFFPKGDHAVTVLSTFAIYSVGFLARPLGGYVFGVLGDRIGRRPVLFYIIVCMGGATMAIGLLPTYEQIGIFAPLLLIVCRLIQGFSAAGETPSSNAFVAEHAPAKHRSLYVGFTYSFSTCAPVIATVVVLGMPYLMTAETYAAFGWRIPFIIGGPLALIGLYIRLKVDESPACDIAAIAREDKTSPLREALSCYRGSILRGFLMGAFGALGFFSLSGYFVSYLVEGGLPRHLALISNGIAMLICFFSFWVGGLISDRIGRRPVVLGTVAFNIVIVIPAFMLASSGSFTAALAGQTLLGIDYGLFYAAFGTTVVESFPARIRVTGTSVAFNLASMIFGGTAPILGTWLIMATGNGLSPAYYTMAVAVVVLIGLRNMPETAGTHLFHGSAAPGSGPVEKTA